MNPSTLLKLPGAPPDEPPDAVSRERRAPTLSRERAKRYQRAYSVGVILSVIAHVLVIAVSPLIVRYVRPEQIPRSPPPIFRPRDDAMRVVQVRVTETPIAQPRLQPEPEPQPEEEPPELFSGEAEPTLSAAEALRPRVGDLRLWVISPTRSDDRTPAEESAALRDRLHAAIEAHDDSLAAALAAEAAAMDWTVGEEGNKWGISPGKLHLGPITLPLPVMLEGTRDQAERVGEWGAIRRQAGQGAVDETFDERVKAIRERKAEEKAQEKAKEDSTSNR